MARIGLVAGSGKLPILFSEIAKAKGDEVIAFGISQPEITPLFRIALRGGPFLTGGKIADDVLEPDVKTFIFKSRFRHADAPVNVPCYRPVVQPFFKKPEGEITYVGAPVCLRLDPLREFIVKGA